MRGLTCDHSLQACCDVSVQLCRQNRRMLMIIAEASANPCLFALQETEAGDTDAVKADAAASARLGLAGGASAAALLVQHLLRAMHAGGDAGDAC